MSQPDPSFLLSAGVAQAVQCMPAAAFWNKLRWFESHFRDIFYVAQAIKHVLGVAWIKLRWIDSNQHISYLAQAFERVLGVAWTKLRWFDSHQHISLCSPGSSMCARNSIKKITTMVRFTVSAYFIYSSGIWMFVISILRKNLLVRFPPSVHWFM